MDQTEGALWAVGMTLTAAVIAFLIFSISSCTPEMERCISRGGSYVSIDSRGNNYNCIMPGSSPSPSSASPSTSPSSSR